MYFFFFQAEDGIRDGHVTGVQTCALPIFTPVLKNCQFLDGNPDEGTYHGYGIQNFLEIDPRFASGRQRPAQELRRFVDDAHAKGIDVIFDIVPNHTGDVSTYPSDSQAPFSEAAYG